MLQRNAIPIAEIPATSDCVTAAKFTRASSMDRAFIDRLAREDGCPRIDDMTTT
jgi:hypothetical protein